MKRYIIFLIFTSWTIVDGGPFGGHVFGQDPVQDYLKDYSFLEKQSKKKTLSIHLQGGLYFSGAGETPYQPGIADLYEAMNADLYQLLAEKWKGEFEFGAPFGETNPVGEIVIRDRPGLEVTAGVEMFRNMVLLLSYFHYLYNTYQQFPVTIYPYEPSTELGSAQGVFESKYRNQGLSLGVRYERPIQNALFCYGAILLWYSQLQQLESGAKLNGYFQNLPVNPGKGNTLGGTTQLGLRYETPWRVGVFAQGGYTLPDFSLSRAKPVFSAGLTLRF